MEQPRACGECPRFQRAVAPERWEWEGTCSAMSIGRNYDSAPCIIRKHWESRLV